MARLTVLLCAAVLLLGIEFVASGCGNGGPRALQSISVVPASADAQNFPNHQVQFTALGNYSQPPSPSQITPTGWSLSDPSVATIGQSGLAAMQTRCLGSSDRKGLRVLCAVQR